MKSRLEAQTAALLDAMHLGWVYEPCSLTFPDGISYTPDFWIPCVATILECRGYETDLGLRQINNVIKIVKSHDWLEIEGEGVLDFIIAHGDHWWKTYSRFAGGGDKGSHTAIVGECCGPDWDASLAFSGEGSNPSLREFCWYAKGDAGKIHLVDINRNDFTLQYFIEEWASMFRAKSWAGATS